MGLNTAADGSQVIQVGADTVLDPAAGTLVMLVDVTTLGSQDVLWGATNAGITEFWLVRMELNGAITVDVTRATTNYAVDTGGTVLDATAWQWVAVTWDFAGADADQHVYTGTLSDPMAEASYTTRDVGSGAVDDFSSYQFGIMNNGDAVNFNRPSEGTAERVWLFDRQLSLEELQTIQYRPLALDGLVAYWLPGFNGTTDVPDFGPNNLTGTVSGTWTLNDGPPVSHPFALGAPGGVTGGAAGGGGGLPIPVAGHHNRQRRVA